MKTITKNKLVKVTSIAVCASIVTSAALAFPSSRLSNTVNIYRDSGGKVIKYALRAKKLAKAQTKVRFAGRCDSACTLYLSIPKRNLCIKPGATFGFHKAYGSTPRGNRTATAYLMKKYPTWVKKWIRDNGGLQSGIKRMDYAYASKYLPTCNKQKRLKRYAFKVRNFFKHDDSPA